MSFPFHRQEVNHFTITRHPSTMAEAFVTDVLVSVSIVFDEQPIDAELL